jgi:hypothetical protein
MTCGPLRVSLADDGWLLVSGYSRNALGLELLRQRLSKIDGARGVRMDVKLRPDALCDTLQVLGRWTNRGWGADFAPYIRTNKASRQYVEGELLEITATSTPAFEGYLYVDYIDSGGNVLHLLPTPKRPDNFLSSGKEVVIGKERQYEIAPPHGYSILTAISSRQALFDGPRPELETVEDYLAALRDKLGMLTDGGDKAKALSSYVFITTRPRRGSTASGGL